MHALQSTWLFVSQSVPPFPEAMVAVPLGQVHVFATHVWAEPAAAVALIA